MTSAVATDGKPWIRPVVSGQNSRFVALVHSWFARLQILFDRIGARRRQNLIWVAALMLLAWLQVPAIWASFQQMLEPYHVSEDARQQIFPFFRYLDARLFATDYVADYYLDCYPLGYLALYVGAAKLGIDPTFVCRVLSHPLWLSATILMAAVTHKLAGKVATFCLIALSLGTDAYLIRIGGGLPRSFGFLVLALALVGLAYARARWCVAGVILGAAFYPVTGLISGMALAASLLLPHSWGCRVSEKSLRSRLILLGGTAAVALALMVPVAVTSARYGGLVELDEVSAFPESGPGGRYDAGSRAPFKGFFRSVPDGLEPSLLGGGEPWLASARAWLADGSSRIKKSGRYRVFMIVLFGLGFVGGLGLILHQPAARRVALVGLASLVGYEISKAIAPHAYLPERYVAYTSPLLGTLLVSIGVAGLFAVSPAAGWRRWARHAAVALNVGFVLAFCGARVPPDAGIDIDLRRNQRMFDHIASLPPDALIAGWPHGWMDSVPYATRRRAFITFETHQAFHKQYVFEMRHRMRALIDAYFGASLAPIERLRDEFGVTHLLVQTSHLEAQPPRYFRPFDAWIAERREANGDQGYEVLRQLASAAVFSSGEYRLLDLARVQATPDGADAMNSQQ